MLNSLLDGFHLPPQNVPLWMKILRLFYRSKTTVRAGTVSFNRSPNGQVKILLLKRKFRGGGEDWTFPKGGVEKGETSREGALRETREEAGIKVSIKADLPDNNYVYYSDEKREKVYTVVKYYLAESKSRTIKPERSWEIAPHVASDFIEEGRWVSVKEAKLMVKHDTERRVLDAAQEILLPV